MTVDSLLNQMSIVDNELDISAGGADETRAITALDMAQTIFESILANHPDTLGTISTLTTTPQTETTAWPVGLLRLDSLYLLDANGRQLYEIEVIQDVGGQSANHGWPWNATGYSSQGSGAPRYAYTNRQYLFWTPIPDQAYPVRVYGLTAKADFTLRTQPFLYPDEASTPLAVLAERLLATGVGDPAEELRGLANELFAPVLNMLRKPTRQRPASRVYGRVHTT